MYLAVNITEALKNFWSVYSGKIVPVLVTLAVALITWLAVKIRSDAKLNKTKTDTSIALMTDLANKESVKPEIDVLGEKVEKLGEEIAEIKDSLSLITNLFNTAFQGSSLDETVKAKLSNLANKITSSSKDELIDKLSAEKDTLLEKIETLKNELAPKVIEKVQEEVAQRIRR